jgi:hypothetical protein
VSGLLIGRYALAGFGVPSDARQRELLGGIGKAGSGAVAAHHSATWPAVAAVAAVLTVLAGVLVAARSRGWSGGLSARYDAPVEAVKSDDPWRQLDRGEDPTINDR